MEDALQEFSNQYAAALEGYLAGAGEIALSNAYNLGRQALGYDAGMLAVTAAHHQALSTILLRIGVSQDNLAVIKQAADFLSECLSPFEMAQRGFHDSIAALRDLNDTLHSQQQDLHLLLSPMPNLLLTVDESDCLAAFFVPPNFPHFLEACEVGMALVDILPQQIGAHIVKALAEVRQSKQIYRLECPLNFEGQTLCFDLQISPVINSSEVLLVINDITERKKIQIAEHKQRILAEALRNTAVALNSSLDLNEVLDRIVMSIGQVVPYDTANIMLLEGNVARIVRSFGYAERGLANFEKSISKFNITPEKTAIMSNVIESKGFVIVSDLGSYNEPYTHAKLTFVRSTVCVPILVANTVIGLINLYGFKPDFFTIEHAENLQTFANQAAIAIQNAHLFEQAQEVAALNERQRLARDLHDSVSQGLFSITIIAESLPRLWEREPKKVIERIKEVIGLTRGVMAEMRTLLLELRPEAIVRSKLGDLLKRLLDATQSRKSLNIQFTLNEQDEPLPSEVHVAFYRIAQEGINNVLKHSDATHLVVEFTHTSDQLALRITDNGKGFDLEQKAAGLGLGMMQERAETIGATLHIESEAGKGTVMSLVWTNESSVAVS